MVFHWSSSSSLEEFILDFKLKSTPKFSSRMMESSWFFFSFFNLALIYYSFIIGAILALIFFWISTFCFLRDAGPVLLTIGNLVVLTYINSYSNPIFGSLSKDGTSIYGTILMIGSFGVTGSKTGIDPSLPNFL